MEKPSSHHCCDVVLVLVCVCVRLCACISVCLWLCYSRLSAVLNTCYSWKRWWPQGPNAALIPSFLLHWYRVCVRVRVGGGDADTYTFFFFTHTQSVDHFCQQTRMLLLSHSVNSNGNPKLCVTTFLCVGMSYSRILAVQISVPIRVGWRIFNPPPAAHQPAVERFTEH